MISFRVVSVLLLSCLNPRSILVQAQGVNIVYPPPGSSDSDLTFNAGHEVPLQWTSTYPILTVQVWQGPDHEGTKAFKNIFTNHTNTAQNYQWTAQPLAGMAADIPMHIRILNPVDKDCETCQARSVSFSLVDGTNKTAALATKASAAASSPPANASSKNSTSDLKLGLGIGLGLGLPLVAAIASLGTWLCLRRRWQDTEIKTVDAYEAPMETRKHLPPPAPITSATSPDRAAILDDSRSTTQHTLGGEIDGSSLVELQPELMRFEADRDAEMVELEGNVAHSELHRKFSWQYS